MSSVFWMCSNFYSKRRYLNFIIVSLSVIASWFIGIEMQIFFSFWWQANWPLDIEKIICVSYTVFAVSAEIILKNSIHLLLRAFKFHLVFKPHSISIIILSYLYRMKQPALTVLSVFHFRMTIFGWNWLKLHLSDYYYRVRLIYFKMILRFCNSAWNLCHWSELHVNIDAR